jgi:predicted small metal-binding protein
MSKVRAPVRLTAPWCASLPTQSAPSNPKKRSSACPINSTAPTLSLCEGTARGESEEDVLQAAAEHASHARGMDELPDEVVEKVKASILEE